MTKKYGLIGYPLSHSFSQRYFTEKFARENIDAVYENHPLASITLFPDLIAGEKDLFGLNVTIPYKQAVMPYLDALSPDAKAIGAVNVVKIERAATSPTGKGSSEPTLRLTGYNCDFIGFREAIRPTILSMYGADFSSAEKGLKALILGTGGASKAVRYALEQMGIAYTFVSRTPVQGPESMLSYTDLTPEVMAQYAIIVNTTPLGMSPNTDIFPDIPYDLLDERNLLYDLVYNPLETTFLRKGREMGARTLNGLEMLYLQAEATWKILK